MSLFSRVMHYIIIGFPAMVHNNFKRTAKQFTTNLVNFFAGILKSESCRNDLLACCDLAMNV